MYWSIYTAPGELEEKEGYHFEADSVRMMMVGSNVVLLYSVLEL